MLMFMKYMKTHFVYDDVSEIKMHIVINDKHNYGLMTMFLFSFSLLYEIMLIMMRL